MAVEMLGYAGMKIPIIIIELANIGFLSVLIYLYIKSYRQIKIGFTVGLMLFALTLLSRSITTIAFVVSASTTSISVPMLTGSIIQLIALMILLKMTWDY